MCSLKFTAYWRQLNGKWLWWLCWPQFAGKADEIVVGDNLGRLIDKWCKS
jgi:hypothetical protein